MSDNQGTWGDVTPVTDEYKNQRLSSVWRLRGVTYRMYGESLLLDYGGPTFEKRHVRAYIETEANLPLSPNAKTILRVTHTLTSYMMLGFETGIRNEFDVLRAAGMPKDKTMEVVMFTQLYAGMRGLGHVYRAVGDFLPAYAPPTAELEYPATWDVDPGAFISGLDLSTREMTANDRENLTAWYESNVGYLPKSIAFGLKYHPEFVKVNRAKWEVAIRTIPKQFAPFLMIRHNMASGNTEGLRESVLLGKAWGMTRDEVIFCLSGTVMYFTVFEGFYTAARALDDILEAWTEP